MLSRHDRKQPPHAFSKPTPHSDSAKVDAICRSCQSQVFSAGLYSTLKSSQLNARDSIVIKYGVSAAEFYASVESGCKWCESLMSGVLTAAHLDYWHDHWNGSHSDGSSMQSNEQDPNVDMELSEGESDDSNEQLDDMTEMSDARESEEGLTLEYVDFKKWPGELSIQLCIKTTESTTLYAAIEVDINLHWDRDELEGLRPLPNFDGEQVVNMLFEAFASPGTHLSSVFSSHDLSKNPASEELLELARNWIAECNGHHDCQRDSSGLPSTSSSKPNLNRIPRHLIEIDNEHGPRIVLHSTLSQDANYAALSYVWGQNQTYVLNDETFEEKRRGLDVSRLPQTIIDAITVTKGLGLTYLWVDALCILQYEGDQMSDEIAVMGQIYQNSEVTIIAANSSSCIDGFIKEPERPTYFVEPFDVPLNIGDGNMENISLGYRSFYKPLKDPINLRAWTLQEKVMSTRSLIYAYDGLKWVCRTCEKNLNGPPGAPELFQFVLPREKLNASGDPEEVTVLRESWTNIWSEYTERKLTYGRDKLPAISAVAFEVAKATGWTYIAGLWKEYLFVDLHWHSNPHSEFILLMPRPTDYRAPSWSWASVDGHLVAAEPEGDEREPFHFEIISCNVEHTSGKASEQFRFDPINSGRLVVNGRLMDLHWKRAEDGDQTDMFLLLDDHGTTYVCGEATFDAQEPGLDTADRVSCLAMSVLRYENRKVFPVEGLLLLPHQAAGTYRRIGFFQIYGTAMFDGVEEQVVQIL